METYKVTFTTTYTVEKESRQEAMEEARKLLYADIANNKYKNLDIEVKKEGQLPDIQNGWSIQDIIEYGKDSMKKSITDDAARKILNNIIDKHDATIGINWDVIDAAIDAYKGEGVKPNFNNEEFGKEIQDLDRYNLRFYQYNIEDGIDRDSNQIQKLSIIDPGFGEESGIVETYIYYGSREEAEADIELAGEITDIEFEEV